MPYVVMGLTLCADERVVAGEAHEMDSDTCGIMEPMRRDAGCHACGNHGKDRDTTSACCHRMGWGRPPYGRVPQRPGGCQRIRDAMP